MKPWFAACAITFLLLAVFLSGCAGKPAPAPTPTPTMVTTQPAERTPVLTVPTAPPGSMEPQPTEVPPYGWTTILTVSRNPSTYQPDIIVTYGGGTGQYVLQGLKITVTHPDGRVETAVIPRPEGGSIPAQTTEVIPQSVNEPVRVQISAMYNGITYSVYDQVVPPV